MLSEESPVKKASGTTQQSKQRLRYQEIEDDDEDILRIQKPERLIQTADGSKANIALESERLAGLESIHDSLNEDFPAHVVAEEDRRQSRMQGLVGSTSHALVPNEKIDVT